VRTLFRFTRIDREALCVCSLQRVTRILDQVSTRFPRAAGAPRLTLLHAARRLDQAARFCPLPLTCLSKALASKALLARYGYAGELCIGVAKTDGKFEAHAWLECGEERVLIGNPMPEGKQYVRLQGMEGFSI
jgi:hypothetical protein